VTAPDATSRGDAPSSHPPDDGPPAPSERELQALKILWRRGEATVRDVFDELVSRGEQLAYTTVLSLLQVMEQKGLVGHRALGKTYHYFAKVPRDGVFRRLAGGFLDSVFDGAMDEYVVHALSSRPVSSDEIARLESMLAAARLAAGPPSNGEVSARASTAGPEVHAAPSEQVSRGGRRARGRGGRP
jgi:BlaI family penicillinase repressor